MKIVFINLLIIAVIIILPALLLMVGLSPSLFLSSQFSPEPDSSVKFFTDFSSDNLLFRGGFFIFGLLLLARLGELSRVLASDWSGQVT